MTESGSIKAVPAKTKPGWSYAEAVAGHKIAPPPPPMPVIVGQSSTRVYERHICSECDGSGYSKPETTSSGLQYQKVCKSCNGKGWWIDWHANNSP